MTNYRPTRSPTSSLSLRPKAIKFRENKEGKSKYYLRSRFIKRTTQELHRITPRKTTLIQDHIARLKRSNQPSLSSDTANSTRQGRARPTKFKREKEKDFLRLSQEQSLKKMAKKPLKLRLRELESSRSKSEKDRSLFTDAYHLSRTKTSRFSQKSTINKSETLMESS